MAVFASDTFVRADGPLAGTVTEVGACQWVLFPGATGWRIGDGMAQGGTSGGLAAAVVLPDTSAAGTVTSEIEMTVTADIVPASRTVSGVYLGPLGGVPSEQWWNDPAGISLMIDNGNWHPGLNLMLVRNAGEVLFNTTFLTTTGVPGLTEGVQCTLSLTVSPKGSVVAQVDGVEAYRGVPDWGPSVPDGGAMAAQPWYAGISAWGSSMGATGIESITVSGTALPPTGKSPVIVGAGSESDVIGTPRLASTEWADVEVHNANMDLVELVGGLSLDLYQNWSPASGLDGPFVYYAGMLVDTAVPPSTNATGSLRWPMGVGDYQNIPVTLTVTIGADGGWVSFWRKISSEGSCDYLRFYIDGLVQGSGISGTVNWAQVVYPLTTGTHELTWKYETDSSAQVGSNTPWIALVQVTGVGKQPPPTLTGTSAVGVKSSGFTCLRMPLTPYSGESSSILAPVRLTGMLNALLPPPEPPVDFDGLADPAEAPSVIATSTTMGYLPGGTYRYAYAAWTGGAGMPTAPSPWSEPGTLSGPGSITLTYLSVEGADGYLVYREDAADPERASAVEVTRVATGDLITSIDTGAPVGTFPADGTQVDQDGIPFPVGTPLVPVPGQRPVPAGGNSDWAPIITVNSSKTWTVAPVSLRRESLIFNRPTKFGRFHQPLDWVPASIVSAVWGTIQIVVAGKDVTYFRAHPAEIGAWSSNEPNGDAVCTLSFPQISWFERPNHGELAWIEDGKPVDIILHRPNGTRFTLFEGLLVGAAHEGQGAGISLEVLGVLYQADHTPYIQELYKKNRDIGSAIADIMDGTVSRKFLLCNRPKTGIRTNVRGSGGPRLTQGVQDLLATAFTSDASNQWTITNTPGRKPLVKLKSRTIRHWTMAMGHPGLTLNIANDWQQMVGVVYGSGTATDGGTWFNAKYPGVRTTVAPLFPLAVGQVFFAGSGTRGFDAFADQMRTGGCSMASGDTYSSADIDEVRDLQRNNGVQVDGIVGAQTWTAGFGVGGSTPSLAGAHIAPLAAVPAEVPKLERPDGSIIGPNPAYQKTRLAIGRLVEYGQDVSRAQGVQFARGEIKARLNFDPMWVGTATLTMDPENGSRWEMKAGQNLFVKFMYPALRRVGIDDGLLLHISQAVVTPGGDVTLQLSYLAHDMTTLAAIQRRNKDTLDPARRGVQSRMSRITQDSTVPWDAEAGGGKIPLHNLQGGLWTVIRIPAGNGGSIVTSRYVCATTAVPSTINTAFTNEAPLSGAKAFCIAVFSKPITANFLHGLVGNPLTYERVWTKKAVQLEKAGLIQAYGASDQPGGYWPGAGSESDPLTGKMMDGSAWSWESSSAPYLWIAEYCASSTRVAGQFRNAPLGT